MRSQAKQLYQIFDYQFKNHALLKQALTHRSIGADNNERYEFLGDAILNLVIANVLFELFPTASEGKLSHLRAYLVNGEMLAEIAHEINLGSYLYLGQGELKSGGYRRNSILADALEAVFAAIFLDENFTASQKAILHLYRSRLEELDINHNLKDYKSQLQEYLQANKLPLPMYTLTNTEGEEHAQVFFILGEIANLDKKAQAHGMNRRKAEQQVAKLLLEKLGVKT